VETSSATEGTEKERKKERKKETASPVSVTSVVKV
jgi:hypothetical protein